MLRSNSKSLGKHAVSSEEEKERLRWERFAEKEGGNWIYSASPPTFQPRLRIRGAFCRGRRWNVRAPLVTNDPTAIADRPIVH